MGFLDEPSYAISTAIILLATALALPYINITFPIELHLGEDLPTIVTTIMRIGVIALAIAVGSKPLSDNNGGI